MRRYPFLSSVLALSVAAALATVTRAVSPPAADPQAPPQNAAAPAAPAAAQTPPVPPRYSSRIMIYDLDKKTATLVHHGSGIWEAPNWSRDGSYLLVNSAGRLYRVPVAGGQPVPIALDTTLRANNDHDFSRDGKLLAISASTATSGGSQVYVANADGTNHRLVVLPVPSYFHGWSPDGKFLAFVANRDKKQYDLYRVPVGGGAEERLTVDPSHEDGTDYSPDGKWIYFNSDRAGGGGNIWRMPATGAGTDDRLAERVTNDALEDWFPHPSPDGKTLLFLSLPAGTVGHDDRNLRVQVRTIPLPGDRLQAAQPQVVHTIMGGQGTMNVSSWAPDSRRFAYVEYTAPIPTTP